MTTYSVADAKARLSELIDRALEGEAVVITRHGQPTISFTPVKRKPGPPTKESIDWLEERLKSQKASKTDSVTLIRKMRDEDWK
ncbi:MAG: type II toxin-antitoxin system prevent-host-death family antitoxin [Hyphomonadaceae bacterium]|nr:type II toxin-antitoxin system prevent-host-death family antitoxin [Hyphomonadaceae bacterium]